MIDSRSSVALFVTVDSVTAIFTQQFPGLSSFGYEIFARLGGSLEIV